MNGLRRFSAAVALAGATALTATFGAGAADAKDYGDLVTSEIDRADDGDVTLTIRNAVNPQNSPNQASGLSCTLLLLKDGAQDDARSAVENAQAYFAADYSVVGAILPALRLRNQFEALDDDYGVPGSRVGEGIPGDGGGFMIVHSNGGVNSHTWTDTDGAKGYIYLCMGHQNTSGASGYGLIPGGADPDPEPGPEPEVPGGSLGGSLDFGGSLG